MLRLRKYSGGFICGLGLVLTVCLGISQSSCFTSKLNIVRLGSTAGEVIPSLATAYEASLDVLSLRGGGIVGAAVTIKRRMGEKLQALSAYHLIASHPTDPVMLRQCDLPLKKHCNIWIAFPKKVKPEQDLVLFEGVSTEKFNGTEARIASLMPLKGSSIWAIGSAFGLSRHVVKGIVTNIHIRAGVMVFMTDAALFFGHSGGGMFNEKGELIGINHAVMRMPVTLGNLELEGWIAAGFSNSIALPHIIDFLK